ncbi:MAG: hypothetical protein AUK16_02000 [Parcubacteria group bacterium CG2_30_44_11]|nr:MAG: hypothetical protein AUK16_02000 [Parcubacteria group bacterium CG2_30_44_11]
MLRSYRRDIWSASILGLSLLAIVTFLFLSHGESLASHTDFTQAVPLTGWMWAGAAADISGQKIGLGWISLNCSNDNDCSPAYSVQINPNLTVTGYGWSPYTGWVQFGGLSGCPAGNCTARVTGSNAAGWELSGWARACAVFVSGCSGTLKDNGAPGYARGNWDGWISLNCANTGGCGTSNYKVSVPSVGGFTAGSNAWGSDVLGRVNFAFADFNPPCTPHNTCSADLSQSTATNLWCTDGTPVDCSVGQTCSPVSGSCTANPVMPPGEIIPSQTVVKPGDVITITWTSGGDPSSCTLTANDGLNVIGGATGSTDSNPITLNRTIYTLTCTDAATGIPVVVASTTIMSITRFEET